MVLISETFCYPCAMSHAERLNAIAAAVEELDQLAAADAALTHGDPEAAHRALERAVDLRVRHTPPVPVTVAAGLLGVSEPTVRRWLAGGILESAPTKPLTITPSSLLRVRAAVQELRDLGRSADALNLLLWAIDDEATLQDPLVQASLQQARTGAVKHYVHRRG